MTFFGKYEWILSHFLGGRLRSPFLRGLFWLDPDPLKIERILSPGFSYFKKIVKLLTNKDGRTQTYRVSQ